MSDKEACFKEALDAYKDATGNDLGVTHHQQWVQDANGSWRAIEEPRGFWGIINSIMKTFRIQDGLQDPRPPGSPNPTQLRVPDMTVRTPDGRTVVVDNKFTRPDGTKDTWGTRPGTNGNTQKQDYDDINRQNNPGNDKVDDLYLDKDRCGCKGEPRAREVLVQVPSLQGQLFVVPLPSPGLAPMPMPGLGPGLIPVFP